MQVSEILRKLADLVDQTEGEIAPEMPAEEPCVPGAGIQVTHLEPVEVDNTDGSESEPMVSPLQQQHELMKKSQGVDNHVEEFAAEEQEVAPDDDLIYKDQIQAMQKIAGIGEENQGPHNYAEDLKPASLNPRANAALEANSKPHLTHTKRLKR